jgi:hypothetical protein
MAEKAGEGGGPLSELQLGIRELFRIAVPGAYAVILLRYFAPTSPLTVERNASTLELLAATFFLGLFLYALRVHSHWWPYDGPWRAGVERLGNVIRAQISRSGDHRDLYKYFLTTAAPEMRDRVHYFSSFYYMLCELSLVSFATWLAVVVAMLLRGMQGYPSWATKVAWTLFALAALYQSFRCTDLHKHHKGAERLFGDLWWQRMLPAMCVAAGILWLTVWVAAARGVSVLQAQYVLRLSFALPVAAVFLFCLANWQWTAIIGEQTVLVTHKRKQLNEMIKPAT